MQAHTLGFGACLDLHAQDAHRPHALLASGRGAQLIVPRGWTAVLLPLSGQVLCTGADLQWPLLRGRVVVAREPLSAIAYAPASWLAVAAGDAVWRAALGTTELLPYEDACSGGVRRALFAIARRVRDGRHAGDLSLPVTLLACALAEQQARWLDRVAHGRGRWRRDRARTLLRLLAVRLAVQRRRGVGVSLERLAATANYSPSHLARLYREAFGETPSDFAARLRLEHALVRVTHSDEPVCDIAHGLGFASESAFCRAFRQRFGTTTTAVRAARRMAADTSVRSSHRPSMVPIAYARQALR